MTQEWKNIVATLERGGQAIVKNVRQLLSLPPVSQFCIVGGEVSAGAPRPLSQQLSWPQAVDETRKQLNAAEVTPQVYAEAARRHPQLCQQQKFTHPATTPADNRR